MLQFHYHALSEHTINGNHFPIEIHLVHKHSDSDYAILGIMFQDEDENTLFSEYLTQFPVNKGKYVSNNPIGLGQLLPPNLSYYNYSGSLTTPPCYEEANWYVLKNPLNASKEQIEKFTEILHNN